MLGFGIVGRPIVPPPSPAAAVFSLARRLTPEGPDNSACMKFILRSTVVDPSSPAQRPGLFQNAI
jgi:hypothetical protein